MPLLQVVKIIVNSYPAFHYFGKLAPDLNVISMLFLSSFWSLRKAVNTAVHRRGLFLYPASSAVLHHWQLLLVYGFQISFATAWFLFLKLSYKNILQNTRRKPYKAMMYCIHASPPSQDLSFCPWKDEKWFEIVFEISVLITHVPHIGDRKVLSFHFLYQTQSKFNKLAQVIVVMLQNIFIWSTSSLGVLWIPCCLFSSAALLVC